MRGAFEAAKSFCDGGAGGLFLGGIIFGSAAVMFTLLVVTLALVVLGPPEGRASGPGPTSTFVRHVVPLGAYDQVTKSVMAGDLDGNGSPDVMVAGANYLAWYHNQDWTPHLIATGQYGEGAAVVLRDVNGDGRVDVITGEIAGQALTRTEVWFENTASGWVRHVLSSTAYCHDLVFGDLNGDGVVNEAMCVDEITGNGQVVTLTPTSDARQPWTVRVIDPNRDTMGSAIADIDQDGRLDVVAGRAWYRNTGASPWPRYAYTTMTSKTYPMQAQGVNFDDYERLTVLDLNGDGRPDIFVSLFTDTPDGKVYAFLAPTNPINGPWTPVQVDPGPIWSNHSIQVADFDKSGRTQILIGEMAAGGWAFGPNPDPQSYIYRVDGAASDPAGWTRILVENYGMHEAKAIDVDADGWLDIVSGQENYNRLNPPRIGEVDWWQNTTGAAPPGVPVNLGLPAVSGTAQAGQSLSATTGSWSNSPTSYGYQWRRCDSSGATCADIAGATAATYLLVAADQGSTIRIQVTASNAGGPGAPADSAQTAVVVAAPPGVPVNLGLPAVSGTTQAGQSLSATTGSWSNSPTSYGYQWRRCNSSGATCADIGSAAASTYLLQAADVGSTLRVRVIASNAAGPSAPADSAQTTVVSAAGGGGSFGAAAAGSLSGAPGSGYKFGSAYPLAAAATATTFEFYARGGTAAQSFTPAIYTSTGTTPGTLVATGQTVTVAANQPAGWVSSTLPSTALAAGSYYLVLVSGTASNAAFIYYNTGAASDGVYNTNPVGVPAATFGSPSTEPRKWSYRVRVG